MSDFLRLVLAVHGCMLAFVVLALTLDFGFYLLFGDHNGVLFDYNAIMAWLDDHTPTRGDNRE